MDTLEIKPVIKKLNQVIRSRMLTYLKMIVYLNNQDDRNMIIYHIAILKQLKYNLSFIFKTYNILCDYDLDDYVIDILNLIYEYIEYICDEITNFNTSLELRNTNISFLPKTSSVNTGLNSIYQDSIDSMMNELNTKLNSKKQKSKFKKKRD